MKSLTVTLTNYIAACFSGLWIETFEPDEAIHEILECSLSQTLSLGSHTVMIGEIRDVNIHDPLGRTVASIQYVAANKWQVHAVRFDWLSRAVENLSGVTATLPTQYSNIYSNNAFASYLKTTAKSEYDASGKLVRSLRFHGTGANDSTGVRYHYDAYNRTRAAVAFSMTGTTETPFGPYQVTDYDWLGRAVASAMFETAPTWSTVVANDTYAASTTASRRGLSKNTYDTLGRLYKNEVHQVAATGAASNPVVTNFYYDAAGRQVASQQQNGLGSETAYDAIGRAYQTRSVKALATTKYSSGRFVYLNPQPKPTLSSMTGGAAGVLTVSHSEYDTAGNTISQYTLDANPNQSTGISISSNNFVRRSVFIWYDIAGRLTTQADYGSGASTWIYAAAPARPTTAPTASGASCLVTRMLYNATNGRLETVIDPKAVQHKTFTDALGRTLFTVQNFTTFASLASPGNTASDKDVVTGYAYNGLGQLESLTAVNPTTGNQVTKYLYEDPVDASLETSAIYPDSTDTASGGTDQVKTTYHLDGLVATRTDQNGTVHTYAYDAQRRETADHVTTLAASIDGTVRKITRSYNWFGALEILSSIDNNNSIRSRLPPRLLKIDLSDFAELS